MTSEREASYLQILRDHDAAIRRLAATYERDQGRRQDLLQDIWMALWQALPSFRGDCSERTFVFRIAHNRGVDHIKHWRMRHAEPLDEVEPVDQATPDPEHAASAQQRRTQLDRAVSRLPLGLRQATVLMLEGLSHREISQVLGITENSVAVRLTRARAALRKAMDFTRDRSHEPASRS